MAVVFQSLESRTLLSGTPETDSMAFHFAIPASATIADAIAPGSTVDPTKLPSKPNICWVPPVTMTGIKSVTFYDGAGKMLHTEGATPYAVFYDDHGVFREGIPLTPGPVTYRAVANAGWGPTTPKIGEESVSFVVATPVPAPVPVPVSTFAGGCVHLDADLTGIANVDTTSFEWSVIDATGEYNELKGYTYVHVFNNEGVFPVSLVVTQRDGTVTQFAWSVTVTPAPAMVPFTTEAELRALASKGNVLAVAQADLTVNGTTISAAPNTIIDGNGHKLTEASTLSHSTIDDPSGGVIVRNFVYDNPARNARIFRPHKHSAAINITILRAGEGFNLNNLPSHVLLQDITVADDHSVRGATVWIQGDHVALLGIKSPNSMEAQTVRSGGTDYLLVAYCDLANTDADGAGPDFARQSLAIHPGKFVTVYKNKLSGGRLEFGPLGGTDGFKPSIINLELNHVQVLENTVHSTTQEVQVCHRTKGIRFSGNDVIVPKGFSGMKIEDAADVLAAKDPLRLTDPAKALPFYGPTAIVSDVWVDADNSFKHPDGSNAGIYRGVGATNLNIAV